MRRLMVVMCLLAAGCSTKPTTIGGGFRPAAAPIYSNAAFDAGRLAGRWDQVAAFSGGGDAGCGAGEAVFVPKDGSLQIDYRLCLAGQTVAGKGDLVTAGPGRFSVKDTDEIGQDWWVLWVDEGYRTLAIGTPSGAFGFILNKGEALPSDRLGAAREVYDFNGYDVTKLSVFQPQ